MVKALLMACRGPSWAWCWRRKGPGRPPIRRFIGFDLQAVKFIPLNERNEPIMGEPIYLTPDELESMRLVYLEGLTQDEASKRMMVSRGTLWRSLENGRRKITQAIVERRPLILAIS